MRTLILQFVVAVLSLGFGLTALAAARRIGGSAPHARAWTLAGLGFTAANANWVLQNVFGSAAFAAGPDTLLWNQYLQWAPVFDHSRTTTLLALFVLFLWVPSVSNRRVASVLLLGMATGGVIGWSQRANVMSSYFAATHFPLVALLDAAELLLLLSCLYMLLVREQADRILWVALCLYGCNLALNVLWTSAMMGLDLPQTWSPSPLHMHVYRAVLMGSMAGLAVRRLALARRSIAVPALFEPLRQNRAAALH